MCPPSGVLPPAMTDQPFHESDLDFPEYRDRLMRKLNALIAVLEVATAKVRKSLAGPAPDVQRLTKIQGNLTSTLEVCRRARRALERREALPEGLPENLAAVVRGAGSDALPPGSTAEMSTAAEKARFERMGTIRRDEIDAVDLDELQRQLMGS